MGKFIPGKEVLALLGIRDFQLFEYVKKGFLQPYDQLGKPKPPPDISLKLSHLKIFQTYLTLHWQSKASEIFIEELSWLVGIDQLRKETKNLEKELSQIDNIYSWKDYSLPDIELVTKKVLKALVGYLYLEEEVQKLEREHGKESQALDVSTKKGSQELTDLKEEEYLKDPELIELLKKARFETDVINDDKNDIIKELKPSGYNLADMEKNLKERLIAAFEDRTEHQKFKFMKKKYLEDPKIYKEDPPHPKRYFVGNLLKKIAKDKEHYPKGIKGKGNYEKLYELSE